jgi:hypothetical protein
MVQYSTFPAKINDLCPLLVARGRFLTIQEALGLSEDVTKHGSGALFCN